MTELILHRDRDAAGRNETDAQGSESSAGSERGGWRQGPSACLQGEGKPDLSSGCPLDLRLYLRPGLRTAGGVWGSVIHWVLWASVFPFLGRGGHQMMPKDPKVDITVSQLCFVFLLL